MASFNFLDDIGLRNLVDNIIQNFSTKSQTEDVRKTLSDRVEEIYQHLLNALGEEVSRAMASELDIRNLILEEIERAKGVIRSKVEEVKKLTVASEEKALILLHNRGRFSAYGSGSRFGIVHDVLGVAEAAEGLSVHRHGNPVSSEFIQKVNPDLIFVIDRSRVVDNSVTNKEEIENLLVKETEAAKNGKIYYLNPEIWYLAGGGITSVNVMVDEVIQAF